ncbi:MAG: hypothetical protein JXR97_03795, partial [Planctomycetes bacterium]|nr:hypothetical protein [Planctomycetota bacterium]
MRKLFILAVVAIFVAYCFAASKSMVTISVPNYKTIELDIFDGKTTQAWEEDKTFQAQRLTHLERSAYQPLESGLVVNGKTFDRDSNDKLKARVYEEIIAANNGKPPVITVRDPKHINEVVQKGLIFRDDVKLPDGKV